MYTFTIYIITQFIHNILEWFTLEKEFEEVVKKKEKNKTNHPLSLPCPGPSQGTISCLVPRVLSNWF